MRNHIIINSRVEKLTYAIREEDIVYGIVKFLGILFINPNNPNKIFQKYKEKINEYFNS